MSDFQGADPLISIIIPVYNEPNLPEFLNRLLQQEGLMEVIVVDGNPRGNSISLLKNQSDFAGVSCFISPRKGRGQQMNFGADRARGEVLLFLHADTFLPSQGLRALSQALKNKPQVVGGAFDLGIDDPHPVFRIIERVSSLRSRWTKIPYGDQALFFKKESFVKFGGFPDLPLMEDLELGRILKQLRQKRVFVNQRVLTSARRWRAEGWVYTTLRNWSILTLFLLGVPVKKLLRFYR